MIGRGTGLAIDSPQIARDLRRACRLMAQALRPIASSLQELVHLDPRTSEQLRSDFAPQRSHEQFVALRCHAAALYAQLMGENEAAIEYAESGLGALLHEYTESSEPAAADDWDHVQFLKLMSVRAEAQASLHNPVLDETVVAMVRSWTPVASANWMDLVKPGDEVWDSTFCLQMIIRVLVLSRGELALTEQEEGDPQQTEILSETRKGNELLRQQNEFLQSMSSNHVRGQAELLSAIQGVADEWRSEADNVTSLADEVEQAQKAIGSLLGLAREALRKVAHDYLRDVVGYLADSMTEKALNMLLDAEAGFRKLVTEAPNEANVRGAAILFFDAIDQEFDRIDLPPYIPHYALLKQLRAEAAHPKTFEFDLRKLEAMRCYLYGVAPASGGYYHRPRNDEPFSANGVLANVLMALS